MVQKNFNRYVYSMEKLRILGMLTVEFHKVLFLVHYYLSYT